MAKTNSKETVGLKTILKKKVSKEERIAIPALKIVKLQVRIIGDSSLICHAWSAKAKKMMLDKQMQKAPEEIGAKNPKQDYLDSLYPLPEGEGYGFPAIAFKAAAVRACTYLTGVPMTMARGYFHVLGELVPIMNADGKKHAMPVMREDMVRLNGKTADIRYRGEFQEWSCILMVAYNASSVSDEQLCNMFNTAGFSTGVGERRPEKNGSNGMFHVG